MAEIIVEEKGKGGRKKVHPPHIDMTPMVDLMCLLITFFMLTTAFSKSKIMEINLPEKIKDPNQEAPRVAKSRTINLILGPNNKIYFYPGGVDAEEYNNLPPVQELDFSDGPGGLRYMLLERNRALFRKINEYQEEVKKGTFGQLSQDSVQHTISQMKRDDDTGPIVLIKAYKEAKYGNFVDILDEMTICGIARYTFVDIAWYEEKMVEAAAGIQSSAKAPAGASAN
ncbi:MAG TPA: biopolymer transporter ExbD [Bacteroidales bacterium]|jgi:biopolymer transport protein ExbD|nr:biopolymer transporter ExbD [Bacteroidales bacterium]